RQQLSIDYQRAEGMRSLEGLARLGAQDPDQGGRDRWEQMGVGLPGDLRKTGAISPVEEVQWLGQFKNHLVANRLKFFSADLQNQLDDLENKSLRDPINVERYHQEGSSLIEHSVGDWLPAEKQGEVQSKFRDAVFSAAVTGRIQADPYNTREQLRGGQYDAVLTQASLIHARAQADTEIDRIERNAEAQRKEREREIGKLVSDYKEAAMAGFPWRGPVSEARLGQLAQGTEHEV